MSLKISGITTTVLAFSDEARLNVEKKYIRLVNPQIVNGCQTARSIEKFRGELGGEVLVRVVEGKSHRFINSMTLYQNSSNPVKKRDFKSNDPVQVRLKHELRRRGHYYEIKRGEEYRTMKVKFPALKQEYPNAEEWGSVSNEVVAKVLAAVKLDPATAAAKGSETFFDDDVYGRLFPEKTSTYSCLAPFMLYKYFIKTSYRGQKRYHKLKKAWPFKNRASHYVLKFLHESMGNVEDWEKKFVSFCEDSTDEEYRRFRRQIKKMIDELFEITYKAWQDASKNGELDYNAYLQNSATLGEMKTKYSKKIDILAKKTRKTFSKFLK